jgi:hypothetical protein
MKALQLIAAILLLAGTSQAQVDTEQRPAPAPTSSSSAQHSGGGRYFPGDSDGGPSFTVPLEASTSHSGSDGGGSTLNEPSYTYAHGDSSWQPSRFVTPRTAANPATNRESGAAQNRQSPVSVSDQIRQIVIARNASSAGPGGAHALQAQVSLGDLARQVRAEKANSEKPRSVIKQDSSGRAVLVQKPQDAATAAPQ